MLSRQPFGTSGNQPPDLRDPAHVGLHERRPALPPAPRRRPHGRRRRSRHNGPRRPRPGPVAGRWRPIPLDAPVTRTIFPSNLMALLRCRTPIDSDQSSDHSGIVGMGMGRRHRHRGTVRRAPFAAVYVESRDVLQITGDGDFGGLQSRCPRLLPVQGWPHDRGIPPTPHDPGDLHTALPGRLEAGGRPAGQPQGARRLARLVLPAPGRGLRHRLAGTHPPVGRAGPARRHPRRPGRLAGHPGPLPLRPDGP